jgi:hypothetical protein
LISCEKKSIKKETVKTQITANSFEIKGIVKNLVTNKVFLNKIIENSLYPIDSAAVSANKFNFKGFVEYPERFAFTFQNYASASIIIIENVTFEVTINGEDISEPIINGSPMNELMKNYQNESKKIFQEISYLFPQFQKARLENDVDKLKEINILMKEIEKEHENFTFSFIQKNKNSFIAPMLLRDQLKLSSIDSLKIKNTYNLLPLEIKKSPDSQIIASELQLH